MLLTGNDDRGAHLWDIATGQQSGPPIPVGTTITLGVAFSPDGKIFATGGGDPQSGQARLWDSQTGKPLGKVLRHQDMVRAVVFSPDGMTLLTSSADRTAQGHIAV